MTDNLPYRTVTLLFGIDRPQIRYHEEWGEADNFNDGVMDGEYWDAVETSHVEYYCPTHGWTRCDLADCDLCLEMVWLDKLDHSVVICD